MRPCDERRVKTVKTVNGTFLLYTDKGVLVSKWVIQRIFGPHILESYMNWRSPACIYLKPLSGALRHLANTSIGPDRYKHGLCIWLLFMIKLG